VLGVRNFDQGCGSVRCFRKITAPSEKLRRICGKQRFKCRLFKFWHDLLEALRTGKPQNETKHGQKGIFEELYEELPKLEQFMSAMTGLSRINFEAFAAKFDFSNFKTLCDVGGAAGLLSIEVAKKHPHVHCTSFDLPPVEPISKNTSRQPGSAATSPAPPAISSKTRCPKLTSLRWA
jgi:hypothetical protein